MKKFICTIILMIGINPILGQPNDTYWSTQTWLRDIMVDEFWIEGQTFGSPDVVVAVLGMGVSQSHEDLAANIWINSGEVAGNNLDDDGNGFIDDVYGWNFAGNNNNTNPNSWGFDDAHETQVAGVIAAVRNKGISKNLVSV